MNDSMGSKNEVRYNSFKDAFYRLTEVLNEYNLNKNKKIEKIFIDVTI